MPQFISRKLKTVPLLIMLGSVLTTGFGQTQTMLWPELHGKALLDSIIANYKTTKTLGYDKARDTMYKVLDLKSGNQLACVYSGFTITLDLTKDHPRTDAYNKGIDCEHSWPQSMGADTEPQRSDLHHIYPTKSNVNSSRGNHPFAEIPDQNTDVWYRLAEARNTKPTSYIDEYSEKENNTPQCFEPREDHKGNVARSMFYFYAMYSSAYYLKNPDTSFWNFQKTTLLNWNYYDPVDLAEYNRTMKIATYQNDDPKKKNGPNPFVLDSTLARRIWFYQPVSIIEKPALLTSFYLHPPQPNPFNPGTKLSFDLPADGHVHIVIFDLKGRRVAELVNEFLPAGRHFRYWNAGGCSAGVYLMQARFGDTVRSGKLLLLK